MVWKEVSVLLHLLVMTLQSQRRSMEWQPGFLLCLLQGRAVATYICLSWVGKEVGTKRIQQRLRQSSAVWASTSHPVGCFGVGVMPVLGAAA